jgi:hypothetical protein
MVDNDDDGEDAAGGRIAHLLEIMVSLNKFQVDNLGFEECYGGC